MFRLIWLSCNREAVLPLVPETTLRQLWMEQYFLPLSCKNCSGRAVWTPTFVNAITRKWGSVGVSHWSCGSLVSAFILFSLNSLQQKSVLQCETASGWNFCRCVGIRLIFMNSSKNENGYYWAQFAKKQFMHENQLFPTVQFKFQVSQERYRKSNMTSSSTSERPCRREKWFFADNGGHAIAPADDAMTFIPTWEALWTADEISKACFWIKFLLLHILRDFCKGISGRKPPPGWIEDM